MSAQLPNSFLTYTRQLMGDDRFESFLDSFEQGVPVSIRLNPDKTKDLRVVQGERVPWCQDGYYLGERPSFTCDPLLHAGCYYVQEAASMFLDNVLRQFLSGGQADAVHTALDLCAAPGGKSTLMRAALPHTCCLFSNEPIRSRANILAENVAKWGAPRHIVTNCYPSDYRQARMTFDIILCDVPCSGEGMFRKDPATIAEWSPSHVERCSRMQRDIVSQAWPCLVPGGILIYSTCTYNIKENEENILWMTNHFDDCEVMDINTEPEWGVTGSLLDDLHQPVFRFIPGLTRSEGLFLCVMRKRGNALGKGKVWDDKAILSQLTRKLNVIIPSSSSASVGSSDGKHLCPSVPPTGNTRELTYQQAMAYLRREALVLPPDTPLGLVSVTFQGHELGLVKNIGTRANNLYPKEWKVKTTHIPDTYAPVLVPASQESNNYNINRK